jgi:hypothetical protein
MAGWFSDLDPRLAILIPGIISGVPGAIALWQWWVQRGDEKGKQAAAAELSRDERRTRELDAQQVTFNAEQSKWFGDLRQELQAVKAERDEARRDANRGWDLARWWHGAAHDVLRAFRNLRHNALNMQQWINAAVQRHGIEMPQTIEPVPDRIDLPMGLEEPK